MTRRREREKRRGRETRERERGIEGKNQRKGNFRGERKEGGGLWKVHGIRTRYRDRSMCVRESNSSRDRAGLRLCESSRKEEGGGARKSGKSPRLKALCSTHINHIHNTF